MLIHTSHSSALFLTRVPLFNSLTIFLFPISLLQHSWCCLPCSQVGHHWQENAHERCSNGTWYVSSDIWGDAVLKRRKTLDKLYIWITTVKCTKAVYFLTKPDDYFGKHGKRINIHNRFFTPCTFRHISRGRIHARIRRFSTFVFTSSPSLRKTLCVNGLSVKVSPPFFLHPCLHRRFWEFIHYAHFMQNEVI